MTLPAESCKGHTLPVGGPLENNARDAGQVWTSGQQDSVRLFHSSILMMGGTGIYE